MNQMIHAQGQLGAHELIGLHESLTAKSAFIELLGTLSQQAQDPQLRALLERQAQAVHQQYMQGVQILQGAGAVTPNNRYVWDGQANPQIGVSNATFPAPNPNAREMSDRSISTAVLSALKFQAAAALHFALECAHTDLRSFLMDSVLVADKMAYEMFSFMNQKGFYQVAQLREADAQSLAAAYQAGGQGIAPIQRPLM